jgi:two-component system chemotaxis response regulator CheY
MAKVLIVEDSLTMRNIIKNVFKQLGFSPDDLLEAENGEEALKILEEHGDEINLITLDVNMPVKNGFDTLKEIRANPKYNHIKIVMITTEAKKDFVIKVLKAGANNYIVKPFTAQTLKKKFEEMNIKV